MCPMKARKYGVECWMERESHKLHAEFWYAHVWMVFDFFILFISLFSSSFLRDCVDWLFACVADRLHTPYTVTGIGLHFFFFLSGRFVCMCCAIIYQCDRPSRSVLVSGIHCAGKRCLLQIHLFRIDGVRCWHVIDTLRGIHAPIEHRINIIAILIDCILLRTEAVCCFQQPIARYNNGQMHLCEWDFFFRQIIW